MNKTIAKRKTVSAKLRSKARSAYKDALQEIEMILKAAETPSIMIDPENDKLIRGQNDNENVSITQVFINDAGKIEIATSYPGGGGLLDSGDYSTDDVITVLEALEETIQKD